MSRIYDNILQNTYNEGQHTTLQEQIDLLTIKPVIISDCVVILG